MKEYLTAAILVSIACLSQVHADSVTLTLYPNQNAIGGFAAGQFRITAKVSLGDNAGLAGYGGDLTGNILSLDHRSPRDTSADTATKSGPAGFTLGRSADNAHYILGIHDITNPDFIVVYGFGQTAGSFEGNGVTVGGATLEGNPWQAELVLATGTFSGQVGGPNGLGWNQNGPNRGAVVFINNTGLAVRNPQQFRLVVPEPTSAMTAGLMLLGLTNFGRRLSPRKA